MNLISFFNKKTLAIIMAVSIVLILVMFAISMRLGSGQSPEITCTAGNLKVHVDATDEELCEGIIAMDKEDGDLTDKIIVESFSDFKSVGVRDVTYAVMDSDMNVSKFARTIEYLDYNPPKFSLKANPVIKLNQSADLLPYMKAKDEMDGDLSGNIRLISSNVDTSTVGQYEQKYAVTNSAGDIAELPLKVTVTDGAAPVELKKYVLYLKAGQSYNYNSLIRSAAAAVTTKTEGNFSKPGICYVDYESGGVVSARLTVIIQ